MARAVRWSGRAKADFRLAVEYIRKDSSTSATKFLRQVLEVARSLQEFPERGRMVPELEDPDVHDLFVGRYRLLYEIHPHEVRVMRLLHGSRDLLLALGKRKREAETEE